MSASFTEVYDFLKLRYKHDRFEGRNGAWCPDYSSLVARSTLEDLEKYGEGLISMYESITGVAIKFNSELKIIKTSTKLNECLIAINNNLTLEQVFKRLI